MCCEEWLVLFFFKVDFYDVFIFDCKCLLFFDLCMVNWMVYINILWCINWSVFVYFEFNVGVIMGRFFLVYIIYFF